MLLVKDRDLMFLAEHRVPGGFREEHDEQTQDDSRDDLNTQAETPLHIVVVREILVRAESCPRSDQGTDTEHKLLQRSHTTTNRRVCDLGLVKRNDHNKETDSDSRNNASCIEVVQRLRTSLQSATEDEDDGSNEDSKTAAEIVSSGSGEHGSKEGATRKDGDYSSFLCISGMEARFKVWRGDDTRDHAEVVAIEDGAHRGEDGDQELGWLVSEPSPLSIGLKKLTW